MKAIDRLYEYFFKKGLKPTAVEKEIGISNGYLSSQKKRSADMGEGILNKIIDYFQDINPIWLITGNGPMLKDDDTGYGLPDKEPSIVAESSCDYIQSNPYYIMYKEKDKEVMILSEEVGALKERVRQLEADRLNDLNQDADIASTKKSHLIKKDVTSANVHSKK